MSFGLALISDEPINLNPAFSASADHIILPDIAALGLRILRLIGPAAMVFEAQYSTRLQGLIECPEGCSRGAVAHPVMDIAEGRARNRRYREVRPPDHRQRIQ